MNTCLENDSLKVEVSSLGAELQSILGKSDQLEYLWQGDATHWARRSPVLFPIVGRLEDDGFKFKNEEYSLGQHGFARNKEFNLIEKTSEKLVFELTEDKETLEVYPFPFTFRLVYRLVENRLTLNYEVQNTGNEELLFSIGAHPAFNCPLYPSEKRSDYSLVFEKKEVQKRQLLESGTRTGETRLVLEDEDVLSISDELFEEDALVFQGLRSKEITLQRKSEPVLTMEFEGFPYFGIWSKSSASPFICLEPWYGIADHMNHNHVLAEKEGIIALASGDTFECAFKLTIH